MKALIVATALVAFGAIPLATDASAFAVRIGPRGVGVRVGHPGYWGGYRHGWYGHRAYARGWHRGWRRW